MMKKFFALLLSLVMILSLSVPAFATETENITSTEDGSNTASQDVTASYTPTITDVSASIQLAAVDADGAAVSCDLGVYLYGSYLCTTGLTTYNVIATGNHTLTGWTRVPTGYKTPADVILSITDTDGDGKGEVSTTSSHAKVELVEGVYVITVTLEKESSDDTAAEITGVSITVDGTTYTRGQTATITPDTQSIIITVTGTNLQNATTDNQVLLADMYNPPLNADGFWSFNEYGTNATRDLSDYKFLFESNTTAFELQYCNDGVTNWIGSGVYVIYESTKEDKAVITGVSITVDGTKYDSTNATADNPAVITPTSNVTFTVTGTNFANATSANYVFYAWGTTMDLTASDVTLDTAAAPNTASFTSSGTEFSSLTDAFEIKYTNDDATNLPGTGIYVIYNSGLSEDELPAVTGVELTSGFASYNDTSKTYTLTPTSGDVTIKITGTNFANLSDANLLYIPGNGWCPFNELWTIDTTNNIATITLSNSDFSTLTSAQQFQFSSGTENVSLGVYLIYQSEGVSVDIIWGAMSFTYSDEQVNGADKGWTCDEGANKITVTNSGTVAVNAAVSYTQADGYDWLSGSFQNTAKEAVTSADIAASGSFDFYLILSGTPTEAFSGTVGSVTVTITKASTSDVTTPEEITPDDGTSDTGSDTGDDAGVF